MVKATLIYHTGPTRRHKAVTLPAVPRAGDMVAFTIDGERYIDSVRFVIWDVPSERAYVHLHN